MSILLDDSKSHSMSEYRRVMKPLLERKRRARINRCLDDLRDLMLEALQSHGGEGSSKLEKADVLEYTVQHLKKLRRSGLTSRRSHSDRFVAGYSACARAVSTFLSQSPGTDLQMSSDLMAHLGSSMSSSSSLTMPLHVNTYSERSSCSSSDQGYHSPGALTPPLDVSDDMEIKSERVWRPF